MMKKQIGLPTVALESLGCKLNQAEIQQMAGQLAAAGYAVVPPGAKADIYVLNTCTVTHVADRKSRHLLRLARRRNPSVRLVAIGCYAQREPVELSSIEGVELVLGNEEKWRLPELLKPPAPPAPFPLFPVPSIERTRAFIKVQDGCDKFCAYCIVPHVRSKVTSVPLRDVVALVEEKAAAGFKECVLTGTEIGDYRDDGGVFYDLVRCVLVDTGIKRVRLSSLQPHHFTAGFLGLWSNTRLCPHFHLSLQSGSDAVLRRMNRRYSTADYIEAVKDIREYIPDAALTTDIIVGFPGETEQEFRESYDLCQETGFARIHVFPYSPRPRTAAALMPGQVPEPVKKERSRKMLALAENCALDFRKHFLGKALDVLWEQQSKGVWSGLTGNYIKVFTKSDKDLTNEITPVKPNKIYRDGVWGEIIF